MAAGFCMVSAWTVSEPLALAQTLEILHTFEGSDGAFPEAGLILARDGNFYGTAGGGGPLYDGFSGGYGTLFKITPQGTLTTLVSFDQSNGARPVAPLLQAIDGNFYGTTVSGGDLSGNNGMGYGTVFKMASDGTLTTLVQFESSNGEAPFTGLAQGNDGNFYGTTYDGEDYLTCRGNVFQMMPDGTINTLVCFSFNAYTNGFHPNGTLVQRSDGNFFGTTEGGGAGPRGSMYGTVFKISPTGELTTLVSFDGNNGSSPEGVALRQMSDGTFYGTTSGLGGTGLRYGSVFKMTSDGTLTTLAAFNGTNGTQPWGAPLVGPDGNFYGTTHSGGEWGYGTIYQMTPDGRLTTLVSFNQTNGAYPEAQLIQGNDDNLYGTTTLGGDLSLNSGSGAGSVFRIVMPQAMPTLSIAQSANQLVLSWPTNAVGFTLQSNSDLSLSTNWVDSADTPAIVAHQYVLTNTISGAAGFYRLKR